jgi:hypothetical protein
MFLEHTIFAVVAVVAIGTIQQVMVKAVLVEAVTVDSMVVVETQESLVQQTPAVAVAVTPVVDMEHKQVAMVDQVLF